MKLSLLNPLGWFGTGRSGTLQRREGKQIDGPLSRASEPVAPVSFDTAMQLSSFWAAARLWSEVMSSLPVRMETLSGDEWQVDRQSDLARLFSGKVNRYQNCIEFFETFCLNFAVFSNAYALKIKSGDRIVGLLPLNSGQVQAELMSDGSVVYEYFTNQGVSVYAESSIWHWKAFGNSITGLSAIEFARNSIAIGLQGDKRIGQVLKNAGKPSGILTIDSALTDEQRKRVKENFKDLTQGPNDDLMVLEAAMKYSTVSMSPGDIQLLESRRFQVEDIARFMDVPSVLINDTQNSTAWGTGIGEIIRGWYKKSVRHRVRSLQESMKCSLIPVEDRASTRFVHDFDDLLRLDKKERLEANQKGVNAAILTPNEARAEENLPPKEGGDELMINGSLVPIGTSERRRPNAFVEMTEEET